MENILRYQQFLNEMWDTNVSINPIRKDFREDETATYEFILDGSSYQVFIVCRRYDDSPEDFQLELHFSSKKEGSNEFTNELTGKNNMQKVMAGVWKSIIQWSKDVCKGGYLVSLIISAKSEIKGDSRRSRIYSDFIARKAAEFGMKIKGSEDISDVYNELASSFGGWTESITTKYFVDKFPIDRLKSI